PPDSPPGSPKQASRAAPNATSPVSSSAATAKHPRSTHYSTNSSTPGASPTISAAHPAAKAAASTSTPHPTPRNKRNNEQTRCPAKTRTCHAALIRSLRTNEPVATRKTPAHGIPSLIRQLRTKEQPMHITAPHPATGHAGGTEWTNYQLPHPSPNGTCTASPRLFSCSP